MNREQDASDEILRLVRLFQEVQDTEKRTLSLPEPNEGKFRKPSSGNRTPKNKGVESVAAVTEKERTENERVREQILGTLETLGRLTVGEDDLIFEGTKFVLPSNMKGDVGQAVSYLEDWIEQQSKTFKFSRTFNYRPWDGAAAFDRAMKKVFGTSGVGTATMTMFGPEPPEYRTVEVATNETIQVPWGRVRFSPLDATFALGGGASEEYGLIFNVGVEAPRKNRAHVEAFLQVVDDELRANSIYRGKAFNGSLEPTFLNLNSVDPSKVIYSEDVQLQLDVNMWSLLDYTDNMRANGVPLKRAVLVEGPYGTGKTLAGMLTAQRAVANGWTFIKARPGKDDLPTVLQTAQLYAPAVVWYEDIDIVGRGESDEQISELLDALDGITNKGTSILAGFTTNHVEHLQMGVLRPGRLDAVIHIGGLDRSGFEKLVKAKVRADSLGDVDYDTVAVAFDGFLPAFAGEAIDRAMRYSIARNRGNLGVLETEDFVNAANGLRPQLELMEKAQEGVKVHPLDEVFQAAVRSALSEAPIIDQYDDHVLTVNANGRK